MPIDKSMSHSEIVQELMDAFKKNGKIGGLTPKNEADAMKIANAIAYKTKNEK